VFATGKTMCPVICFCVTKNVSVSHKICKTLYIGVPGELAAQLVFEGTSLATHDPRTASRDLA
jgi:hypothetical protein